MTDPYWAPLLQMAAEAKAKFEASRPPPKPRPPPPTRQQLEAQLAALRQGFDPNYQHSDDYSFWSRQHTKAQSIAYTESQLRHSHKNDQLPTFQTQVQVQGAQLVAPVSDEARRAPPAAPKLLVRHA